MAKLIRKLTEDMSVIFDKNIDPRVLRDRMAQAARARDLALDAATKAEASGDTALAGRLQTHAAKLQDILDLTRQNANSVLNDEEGSDSMPATPEEAENKSSAENEADSKDTDDTSDVKTGGTDSDAAEADPEDEIADKNNGSNSKTKDDSQQASDEESEEAEQKGSVGSESNTEENPKTDSQKSSDTSKNDASSEDSTSDEQETTSSGSSSSNTDGSEDSSSNASNNASSSTNNGKASSSSSGNDVNDSDDNSWAPPAVKGDTVLQNPFKNSQVQQSLPTDIAKGLSDGSLKVESEIDAIVRIVSKLTGEARRGAEDALKDYFKQIDPWGDIEEND